MTGTGGPCYFAVPDPSNPDQVTYWRRAGGKLTAWPPRARYGPALYRTDVPAGLRGQERQEWVLRWVRAHHAPWHEKVRAAVDGDPDGCAARFAALACRCCQCGRRLTDAASKVYGVGPECRGGWPDVVLAAMVAAVGRAHAAVLVGEGA